MREENVARVRAFAEWLAGGREEAFRNAPELLGRPMAEWDAWLAAHPEATSVHLLQALLKAASGDPRALAIAEFVWRHSHTVDVPPDAEPTREALRTHVLNELSRQFIARVHQNPVEALAVTQLAVDIAGESTPSTAAAYAWRDHATALRILARYEESFAAYDRAEQMLPPFGRQDLARANIVIARVHTLQEAGRFDEAMPLLQECLRVFEKYGDGRAQLFSRMSEGTLLHRMGRYREACEVGLTLLPAAEEAGEPNALASIHNNIGHAAIELQDFALAELHLGEAVRLFAEIGLPLQVARAELARGRLLLRRGETERGIEHLHRVREEFLRHQLVEEAGLCGLEIVAAHLARGASAQAEAFARQIVREFTAARLNTRAITALDHLSEAIAARSASQATVRKVDRFIHELRANPQLEFVA